MNLIIFLFRWKDFKILKSYNNDRKPFSNHTKSQSMHCTILTVPLVCVYNYKIVTIPGVPEKVCIPCLPHPWHSLQTWKATQNQLKEAFIPWSIQELCLGTMILRRIHNGKVARAIVVLFVYNIITSIKWHKEAVVSTKGGWVYGFHNLCIAMRCFGTGITIFYLRWRFRFWKI